MADYHLITKWQFDAPLEDVWEEIKSVAEWSTWWSYVQKVELLQKGDANDIGTKRRLTWKTALPYSLAFETKVIAIEKHRRIEGSAIGELEGKGIWTFTEKKGITHVQYDWIVKTTKSWMNLMAPLLRRFFDWNHGKVMLAGYEGLQKRLAGSKRGIKG